MVATARIFGYAEAPPTRLRLVGIKGAGIGAFSNRVFFESCQETMARMDDNIIQTIYTSSPYWGLRSHGAAIDGDPELGRESDPRDYVENVAAVMREAKRVLRPTGSLFLQLGDTYFGTKGFHSHRGARARQTQRHYAEPHQIVKPDGRYIQHKQLLLLPSRIAARLQDDGWILRNQILWIKTNPQPVTACDRAMPCYEYIFHFVKARRYDYDQDLAKARGRN